MATNKNIDIDKLFRDKLTNYELESPQNIWNNILLQKANKPVWKLSYSIVILLVSVLSGVSVYYMNIENSSQKMLAQQNIQQQIIDNKSADNNLKTDNNTNIQNVQFEEIKAKNDSKNNQNISSNNQTSDFNQKNQKHIDNPTNFKRNKTNQKDNLIADNHSNTTNSSKNSTDNNLDKKDKEDMYDSFNKTLNRDKSIPSLVLNIEKPQPEKEVSKEDKNNTTNTKKDYKPSPWSLEVSLRTVFANSTYGNTNTDWNKQVTARKASESFLPSFGLNVKVNYNVNRIVSFTSGISYSILKQKLDFNHTNTEINITQKTKQGFILNPDGSQTPYSYTYMDTTNTNVNTGKKHTNQIKMIDIPLMLDLKFLDLNKFSLSFQPGIMANIYMKKLGYEINQNADNTEMSNMNKAYKVNAGINYRIGLSAAWNINKNTSIVVQPYYIQNANGMNSKKYPVNYKINQFSTDIGIRFQLP